MLFVLIRNSISDLRHTKIAKYAKVMVNLGLNAIRSMHCKLHHWLKQTFHEDYSTLMESSELDFYLRCKHIFIS